MVEVTFVVASEVSVIVPCYNEGDTIAGVIDQLCSFLETLPGNVESEVIAVDDGSLDRTASILQGYSAQRPERVRFVAHVKNSGLTAAMQTGARHARFGTLVFMDADLSYAPETIATLLRAKEATGAAVAVASPYMAGGHVENVPFVRLLASRGANWLLSFTVGRRIRTFTGMVRAYDAGVFRALAPSVRGGEFNAGMVAAILRAGHGIVEVPAALIWPAARAQGATRLSWRKLAERTLLVFATVRALQRSGRGWQGRPHDGPLVLVQRLKGP